MKEFLKRYLHNLCIFICVVVFSITFALVLIVPFFIYDYYETLWGFVIYFLVIPAIVDFDK